MALWQLGINQEQADIAVMLGTRPGSGTPFSRLLKLPQAAVQITEWGSFTAVKQALDNETAVIAAITTSPGLPGWEGFRTQHAVLIVNITSAGVVYHDPVKADGPTTASRDEFLLAWGEMAEKAAFICSK